MLLGDKQLGLVSWGDYFCDPEAPAVATYLPYYYDWIIAMIYDDGLYETTTTPTTDPTTFEPTNQPTNFPTMEPTNNPINTPTIPPTTSSTVTTTPTISPSFKSPSNVPSSTPTTGIQTQKIKYHFCR